MKLKGILIIAIPAVLVGLVHFFAFQTDFAARFEPQVLDFWFNVRGEIEAPKDVVLIAMDEQTYSNQGIPENQPWPRALHVELLKRLAEYQVKRVAFDVVFVGSSMQPEVDRALAQAFALVPTVLGAEYSEQEIETPSGYYLMEEFVEPDNPFKKSALSIALVGLPEDEGIIRRFSIERAERTKGMQSLSEAAAFPGVEFQKPGLRDFIKYYGRSQSIKTISYDQVIQTELPLPKEELEGKIIFVGLALRTGSGPTQKDTFRSPFYQDNIFGVEIHATAAANLLYQDWIVRGAEYVESLSLSTLGAVVAGALFSLTPLWGVLLLLSTILLWALVSYLSFLSGFFVPGAILVLIVLPLCYLASTLYFYFITRRAQKKIERAFELYLSPEMAKKMAKNQSSLALGGDELYATALFTDIEGFTSISEKMTADRVSAMLNAYFTEVMEVVFEKHGTLIKFIGDAVFVIWGAPIWVDDHAKRAVDTALRIQEEVVRFNASGRFPPLNTRVGVNTGLMVVGNLGSKRRFDYTAIGDAVNLAARVEGINKYFGTYVLITDSVKAELKEEVDSLFVGSVQVVGKEEAVGLHALLPKAIANEVKDIWLEALAEFQKRNWDAAKEKFQVVKAKEVQLAQAVDLYMAQIELHTENKPPDTWQGQIIFSKK